MVNKALLLLSLASGGPRHASRELIVAYATIAAWAQHWPSRATEAARGFVEEFGWVREAERDRYIKQRRVALAQLSREDLSS